MAKGDKQSKEEFKPRGAMALMLVFFVLLVLLWVSVYLTLLARGVTQ
jgi:hypothetical protein